MVAVKSLYHSFENGIENCCLGKLWKNSILSAVAHTCSLFAPTKAKRRPEYHTDLISASWRDSVKMQKQFQPKGSMVTALKKKFSTCPASLIISQILFGKMTRIHKILAFQKIEFIFSSVISHYSNIFYVLIYF